MKKVFPDLSLEEGQWIAWIGATIVAAIIGTSFVYANFQTKADALEQKGDIVQRLDRIESKVDAILSK